MNVDIAEQLSVTIHCGDKNSSGTIYVNEGTAYILTAKHSICPKVINECEAIKRECNTCELKNSYAARVTKISIGKVGPDNLTIKPKRVVAHNNKDLALLVFKDKDIPSIVNLPNIKISSLDDINSKDKFVTCGYPSVTGNEEPQPIHYSDMSRLGLGINFQIEGSVISNLESAKDNLSANSGAGLIKKHDSKNLLVGIYTKTGDISASFGEYINHSVNDLLKLSNLPLLVFESEVNEISTLIKNDFLECFTKLEHGLILGEKRKLNLFTVKLNGKNCDYENLKERLNECIRLFSLPRKIIKQYEEQNKNKKAAKEGDKLFLALQSDHKVAELLLQGFLESHLNAPKLYSFNSDQNKPMQSVHIKFIDTKSCELVYSAAKMGKCLQATLYDSLNELLQAVPNLDGVGSLLSNHLFDLTFDSNEQSILESILLPEEDDKPNNFNNSFSLLIGFDFKCSDSIRYKNNIEYSSLFQGEVIEAMKTVLINIKKLLDAFNVVDAELNCYVIPFSDTKEFCQSFLEEL